MPIRLRLVLWFGSIFAIPLILLGIAAPAWLGAELGERDDTALRAAFSLMVREGVSRADFAEVAEAGLDAVRSNDATTELLGGDGRILARHGIRSAPVLLAGDSEVFERARNSVQSMRLVPPGQQRAFRIVAGPSGAGPGAPVLVIGSPLTAIEHAVADISDALAVGIPVTIALAMLGIWLLTRSALRPITAMVERARTITMDRLDERITVPRSADELGTLAGTLNEMLGRIGQGLAEQQRLIADASHELRTPLTMIRFELELLRESPDLAESDASGVQRSLGEALRMSRMIDNLLTLARFEGGGIQLLRNRIELTEEAGTVAERFRAAGMMLGVDITVEGEPVEVFADRERIDQVITNLLDNAVKYAGEGDIRVRVWSSEDMAGLSVTDQGPGLSEPERERIFEWAERLPSAGYHRMGGSGLGLAICRMIVTAHGGELWVTSEPGQGCTFSCTLPL
ncbi:sensor histidine kinase [Sciscionella sediminilitoris]|uniref:sensor histidine kinase n=1 Tax=Sciscionella sediminilitoris TaxID=1445613 RepID=UPI0004DECFD2|nr:ATP-binding protein [Sciscionella sp. SE31]